MAANKSVNILMPNGRRQNVKVTPNTTILQMLEEVCQKHEFNVNDYDLKHFNNVLDPNAILRFTGLPNNAQLEMIACTKVRSASNVVIGVQLENGERLMGEFSPDTTLIDILKHINHDGDLEQAVLIYMHREIYGQDVLQKTTLKSLGLNSGRAILRLIYRDPEQLKIQAHVAVPLMPKLSKVNKDDDAAELGISKNHKNQFETTPQTSKTLDPLSLLRSEITKARLCETVGQAETHRGKDDVKRKTENLEEHATYESCASIRKDHSVNEKEMLTESCQDNEENVMYNIEFLGERNALVFNQAGAQALPRDELPDHFYDLTVEDARVLLRDVKRRREELEEAPLLTDAQRLLNQEKRMLTQLHKYQRTVIRVQFPDQFVLQGLFAPLETVRSVQEFIKRYLIEPDSSFSVYTTPPKYVLNPDARLIDEDLVPSAIVHFSGSSSLKPEIKEKAVNPKDAGVQATKIRMSTIRDANNESAEKHVNINASSAAGTSNMSSKNNTPRWFSQSLK